MFQSCHTFVHTRIRRDTKWRSFIAKCHSRVIYFLGLTQFKLIKYCDKFVEQVANSFLKDEGGCRDGRS